MPSPAGGDPTSNEDVAPPSEAHSEDEPEGGVQGTDQGGHPMLTRSKDDTLQPSIKYDEDYVHLVSLVDDDETADPICLVAGEEPASFPEDAAHQCWLRAMREELTAIDANDTWKLVEPPPGQRPIGLKWVYKLKKDPSGSIIKYKARMVAKGYVQHAGIDFEEVFAPVARFDSVRLLTALAAHHGWEVHHMDVKSAFLNGDLAEEVFVAQPPGFELAGQERKVFKLAKALYGLRQAPRAWNAKLDSSLLSLGFQRSDSEHGVYLRGSGVSLLAVGLYVDDLIIAGAQPRELDIFKEEMKKLFQMSDLGRLTYYLGIEVRQTKRGITLCQASYAQKLLEKASMAECKTSAVPMEAKLKLSKDSTAPATDASYYRSLIGSLRYLVQTRPDIAYAVSYLSRFMEKPTVEHLTAPKQLMRYIAGTLTFGCVYLRGSRDPSLIGYSDSDLGGDVDDCKSTTGSLFFLDKSPISWQSTKQKVVALSSCEAEYVADASTTCQGLWLARLLAEATGAGVKPPSILIDNKSAIQLSKNPVFHDRSKHIEVRYHFLRDKVEAGKVKVDHVNSGEQLADILTKSLGRVRFQELCAKIGILNTVGG
ncbi:putative polyprotein [Hordeum vulgare]|nr:putative polyprotein [Hordeum vulgare]